MISNEKGRAGEAQGMLSRIPKVLFNWTDLPVVGVIASGIISSFFAKPALSSLASLLLVGLGIIFIGISILVFNSQITTFTLGITRSMWVYFGVQFVLLILIVYISKGSASLAVIPLAAQGAWISRRFTVRISVILLGMVALVHYLVYQDWGIVVQAFFSVGSALVFVYIFTQVLLQMQTSKKEVERLAHELVEANRKLREYSAQVEELATTKERNRLAREIHDSLGHYFTVINVQIEAARTVFQTDPTRSLVALTKAQSLTKEGLNEVRRSIGALRVSATNNKTLPQTIMSLVEDNRQAGIVTEFEVKGQPHPLQSAVELTLYRTTQEALTNIRKHAFASQAQVYLDYCNPALVGLKISDNGVGVAKETKTETETESKGEGSNEKNTIGGFGLLGMRERVHLLNGHLHTSGIGGQGFIIEVEIPL